MLVLLIIFMVAAPLMTVGVPVNLPKTAAAKASQPKQPVVISIDEQGQPFLDKEPLTPDLIMPRLKALASADPAQVVLVRGDRAVPYGRIVEIMGQINAAGFSKVSLIAQAPSMPAAQ
jgi:biopolymer transport protein TolR